MKVTLIPAVLISVLASCASAAQAQQALPPPSPPVPAAAPGRPPGPPGSASPFTAGGPIPAATGRRGATMADDPPPAITPGPPAITPGPPAIILRPPAITLGKKEDSTTPMLHGAARVDGTKVTATASGSTLKATLAATSNAYAWIGGHSTSIAPLRLVQEFDVSPADPRDPRVALTLSAKIDGFFRCDDRGGAALRLAAATLQPACGGPPWGLAFPTYEATGCIAWRYLQETALPPLIVPAGRFVLVADFVFESTAHGITWGHGEAAFSPDAPGGTWSDPDDPFAEVDETDFGLTVTVKAAAPSPTVEAAAPSP